MEFLSNYITVHINITIANVRYQSVQPRITCLFLICVPFVIIKAQNKHMALFAFWFPPIYSLAR